MNDTDAQRRERAKLQGEIDGAAVYHALAASEADPRLAEAFRRLASVEQAHVEFWYRRAGVPAGTPGLSPSMHARFLTWMARGFGPGFVISSLTAEARDDGVARARIVRTIASRSGLTGPELATLEGRHGGSGNTLRAAVLGANDGLVSNLSLVMGVAGAAQNERTLLLTGLAGLIAGACSMAMGEWLSVTSSRELNQKQIATEAKKLSASPEDEKEELVLIYRSKGIEEAQARVLADRLLSNQATAIDTLAREELGIDPEELGGSAWQAGAWSFLLFSAGAIVPVAPFFFLTGTAAFAASLAASAVALMAIGLGTSGFTGRSAMFSALRQLAIGAAAAGITYGVGKLVGVSLS